MVGSELISGELVLCHQAKQHRGGVAVDQSHADVDVLNPQILEGQLDWLAVDTDVGHVPAGADRA
ncbi:hypothetical protein D3C85_1785670 [compost metagenome]